MSAFELGDKKGAAPGLQFIRELFRIEDEIALLSAEDRLRIRNEKSTPIVAAFYAYVEAFPELDADAPMYKAVRYATNQKELLCRFLSNGDVPIHNNCSERALRRGRHRRALRQDVAIGHGARLRASCITPGPMNP